MKDFLCGYIKIAVLSLLGLILLLVDFVSKAYVYHVLSFQDTCSLGTCIEIAVYCDSLAVDFSITFAATTGIAWGFLSGFQPWLVTFRIAMILGLCVYLFFFNQREGLIIPLLLILCGALGNVIDFFFYGFVVDFLHFNLWGY